VIVSAGIDVGNATTEAVLLEIADSGETRVLAHGVAPTRGSKGQEPSIRAAADLLLSLESDFNVRASVVGVAPLRAVHTEGASMESAGPTGPVVDLCVDSSTPFGSGVAVGAAWMIDQGDVPPDRPVIAVVAAGIDFERAAATIKQSLAASAAIVGVVCADDDAVLIGNRLPQRMPVVDGVDVSVIVPGERIAIEVAAQSCTLADPYALVSTFELGRVTLQGASLVARELMGRRAVALVSRPEEAGASELRDWIDELRSSLPGPRMLMMPDGQVREIADAWAVAIDRLDDGAWMRRGVINTRQTPLAFLESDCRRGVSELLKDLLNRPVQEASSEEEAALLGALSTPGVPPDAAVCDLGGGTIDIVTGAQRYVAAGAGELLTLATALCLGIPRTLAEAAKRGPAVRAQSPHLAHDEDGRRRFLEHSVPSSAVGRLCIQTDSGYVALSDSLAPEEWHALRLAIKRSAIAENVARLMRALTVESSTDKPGFLVLAGGVAEDREIVSMVAEVLRPSGTVVGRANVAGELGPRAAVAWGLARAAARTRSRVSA
jgi:hypothetical protein